MKSNWLGNKVECACDIMTKNFLLPIIMKSIPPAIKLFCFSMRKFYLYNFLPVPKGRDILLTIRCAACKNKLWKYDKIGQGEVLRCHKVRIKKYFAELTLENGKVKCPCGKEIGIDKGSFIKMDSKAFVYSGTKRNG